jgi:hypothetical protein
MSKAFKPGDRVIDMSWGKRHGTVVTCAKVTALVDYDWSGGQRSKVHVQNLRAETAADVARREYELAVRSWRAARPDLEVSRVDCGSSYASIMNEVGAYASPKTPDQMRQVSREMLVLAEWFESRPKEPTP